MACLILTSAMLIHLEQNCCLKTSAQVAASEIQCLR